MKIKQVTSQCRNDFTAIMVCEHCGAEEKLTTGYDDAYYHETVIPNMHCASCGVNRAGSTKVQKALEFYANPNNWKSTSTGFALQYNPEQSAAEQDAGYLARQALASATVQSSAPAQPVQEPLTPHEIGEFAGTHEYGPENLKWFRMGEAAHGIK